MLGDILRYAQPVAYPGIVPTGHEAVTADAPPSWRDRIHGGLTDEALHRAAAAADQRAAVEAQRVRDHADHVARERERTAAGHGDRAQRLTDERDHLTGALDASARAAEAATAAQQAREAAAALQSDVDRGGPRRFSRGPDRERLQSDLAAQNRSAAENEQAATAARAEVQRHRQAAGMPEGADASQRLAELERTWNKRRQEAIAEDLAAVQRQQTTPAKLAEDAAAREARAAEELRVEQRVRENQPEEVATTEAAEREIVAREEAERQRQAQAQPSTEQQARRDEPEPA